MPKKPAREKKHTTGGKMIRRRGAPAKNPEDRLDVVKTIKFNTELERKLRAMAKEEKGSKAMNSLVRRLCDQGAEDWMKEKGYTEEDIAKMLDE